MNRPKRLATTNTKYKAIFGVFTPFVNK